MIRLSDSTTLTFLTPALTGLFAHVFLGETFTERELLASLASLVGVVFITWPSFLFGEGEKDLSGERVLAWEIRETHVALGVSLLGVFGAAAACESFASFFFLPFFAESGWRLRKIALRL